MCCLENLISVVAKQSTENGEQKSCYCRQVNEIDNHNCYHYVK